MAVPRPFIGYYFLALLLIPCGVRAQDSVDVEIAFPKLEPFTRPVDLATDGNGYLYVVEQPGKVFVFENNEAVTERRVFLDLSERVHVDNEAGLLSLSFHPEYDANGYFYVFYIVEADAESETEWTAVLSRFSRSESDPLIPAAESELVLLEIAQPTDRHNGGETAFGPDGYLYVSLGDGSRGRDAFGNAQNLETLLGSILRIDVDNTSGGLNYAIPPDNPFAGNDQGYREEIYAYGFRNPWRFSIDAVTGHMWAGDVGEVSWEEVDFVVKGGNYGWPSMEGGACFEPPADCSETGLQPPVWYYPHDNNRVSVIGGYVYRGERVPELFGQYIFADWGGRMIYALDYGETNPTQSDTEPAITELVNTGKFISGFGLDEHNELYMLSTFHDGPVLRFAATDSGTGVERPIVPASSLELVLEGPNPVSSRAMLSISVGAPSEVRIVLYDAVGRQVDVLFDGFVSVGGAHEVEFDAGPLSSGVYLVRAQSQHATDVQRIIVTK